MAKYVSGTEKKLNVGLSSFSENKTSLTVVGNVGIGTTNATSNLHVNGDVIVTGVITATSILPSTDNTGVVGNTAFTWSNGQFTNFLVNDTLTVRAAIDLADSDILQFGTSDDVKVFYDGTANDLEIELEASATKIAITDNGTYKHIITKDGKVGINTSITPTNQLDVNGSAKVNGLIIGSGTTITSVDNDLTSVSSLDDTLASAKAIKSYVDLQVFGSGSNNILSFDTNSGIGSVYINSEVFDVLGVQNEIETIGSGTTLTIGLPDNVRIQSSIVVGSAVTINSSGINAPTGIVTASTFSGQINAGVSTLGITTATGLSATQLSISGVSTFAGITTVTGTTLFSRQLNVSGISTLGITTATGLSATQLSISGVSTFNNTLNVVPTSTGIAGLFSGTTSSDMVRITQLGTGNALVVEDEANPDASPFVVTGVGTVGIGITNPSIKLTVNGGLDSSNRQVRFVNSGTGDLYIKHANLVSSIEAGSSVQLALGGNGAEVVRINSTGVGIGTTNPTSALHVIGDGRFSGVVTATSFIGNASSATYATNAGLSTNLKGGLAGNLVYQSAADTTVFLANGSSGTILKSNGVGNAPSWVNAAPSNAITGITVRDEGQIVGTANSVSQLNFVGNIVSVASSDTTGIATITFSDYIANAGIATYATSAGIATYATTAGIATYATSSGIATYATTAGIATYATSSGIATYATTAGIATYATTSGIATYATTAGIATYATTSGIATYATSSGVSTSVIGGIASVTQLSVSGITTLGVTSTTNLTSQQLSVSGLSTFSGITTHTTSLFGTTASFTGVVTALSFSGSFSGNASSATYATSAGIATYATTSGIATYATSSGIATYATSSDIATYATSSGIATYATTAGVATALQNARTFEITGDIIASPISFNGTGNVSLAATIQPNSVALGTDTTGDYVQTVSGTSNQITVTGGTGEGSTPTLSIPSQFTAPQDVTVTRDLQVNRNLNVTGNITIGGTSATLFTSELKVSDPDLVLGFRTDALGNDVSTDNTANHGGIAIASTEGSPLVQLFIAGIETTPATYKKIMWFKAGTFSGLGTDAWLSNYAVGIGSTQFPVGTRLAAGNVQITQNDLAVVRNINASGIVTASSFSGNASSATYATTAGIATYATSAGLSTHLKGGSGGTIVYQSATDTTAFLANGTSGYILQSNGGTNAPSWVAAAPAGAITGLTIRDEGTIVGTANSVSQFDFRGINITATASGGISTITVSDNLVGTALSISGISTLGVTSTTNLTTQQLNVSGVSTVGFITAINIWNAGITTSSRLTLNGANDTSQNGGQIFLNGATGNRIDFNTNGAAAPAFTTRSVGTKIVLYPSVGGSTVDYAFGVDSGTLWYSVEQAVSARQHRWYAGTTQLADLKGSGELVIGSTGLTGTASQRLQVTGGAYVSTRLGVGVTNPASNTQVAIAGTLGISEVGGAGTRTLFTSSGSGFVLNHNDNSNINIQSQGSNRFSYQVSNNAWTVPSGGTSLLVGTGVTTGTANQLLRVEGGAYVSGNTGLGTTNPAATLQVKDALAFETTNTTTTSTSQVAVDTFATATFRSAKYQVQVTCPGQISTLGGITTGGRGYTPGTFNVTFTTSSGNGSAAQGTLVVSNGTVGQISVSAGGTGYTAGDVLTASGGSGLQVSVGTTDGTGAILTLGSITSAGIGYTAGVGVGTTSLTFLGGTGFNATGLATIFDGVITSSTLLQQPITGTGGTVYYSGSNYSTASVLSVDRTTLTNTITTITGSVGVSTFTSLTTHGLFVNDIIRSSSTSNGLTAGTDYYVVTVPSTTTFTLGTSVGVGVTFTTGSSLSIGFYRNSSNAGGQVAYTNAITGVSTNHQVSDLMVLQNGSTADFIEYATIANSDILGTFAADISGANARLLFTPTYPNNTVKVARQAITV